MEQRLLLSFSKTCLISCLVIFTAIHEYLPVFSFPFPVWLFIFSQVAASIAEEGFAGSGDLIFNSCWIYVSGFFPA